MNLEDKARELLVQDRQHLEHIGENMLDRVAKEAQAVEQTQEQARELLAEDRLHDDHLQEAMLSRVEKQQSH
ncbi:conserved hypothetical protein [Planktothrix sp. PCC 11201]|uniref:hypothetical protein n=1 Tax=Planktothrix sp. PCC 11201 TaxID=1729650 RepID=UPI00091DBB8F|nr:hypothetical protein [Planktothrix sp. PCC 11201]SKB11336.1 conserved hypothetical protein [Planktothrix sp. PCC 11201]